MSSPSEFDKAKYEALLGQLEISIVMLSYLREVSDIFRLDSFFYSKRFISAENKISKIRRKPLKDMTTSLKSFGAYSLNNFFDYVPSGIPFIRGVNMKNGLLDFNDMLYISEDANRLLWKSEVHKEDILLSMSGTIGDVAIAMPNYHYPMNSNQDIAKIHLKHEYNPYYVYAFLVSKYGHNYLIREARGSVQQHVFLSQMENFAIPLFSDDFQSSVERQVKSAHKKLADAKRLYADAERLLLDSLGLLGWEPKNEAVSIRRFSDFTASGRLDAEYYQPKYDEIEAKINEHAAQMLKTL